MFSTKHKFCLSIAACLFLTHLPSCRKTTKPEKLQLTSANTGSAVVASAIPSSSSVAILQPVDVTFLLVSDTHLGATLFFHNKQMTSSEAHSTVVRQMNAVSGMNYPKELGGKVDPPKGLLIAGDLTESGTEPQWGEFVKLFGLTGHDGLLRYPVYESLGNHDYGPGNFVEHEVIKRHGSKRYSWDWGALHVVSLADGPGDDGLDWLEQDLKATPNGTSIVLYLHYPMLGPWSETNWFGKGNYRYRLRRILAPYAVAGIFHGHYHVSGHYRYGKYEVFNSGSIKHNNKSFLVVRVTDKKLSVAAWNYDYERWWWWWAEPRTGVPGDTVFGKDERSGEAKAEFPYPSGDPTVQ